ncbi:MAG: radical SAM protein, partial [Bacteroidota bacterium]
MRPTLSDQLNVLKHLTFRRIWNIARVVASYQASRLTGKNLQSGNPFALSIEPTTSCNLRCPECPSGLRSFTRPTGMLELELFKKALDDCSKDLLYLILYFQGEPYLHPNFHEMVSLAKSHKLYVATSTNAHYLDEATARAVVDSGLDRLIISLDGTTQETYRQYRVGGSLEKVLEGTRNILAARKAAGKKGP